MSDIDFSNAFTICYGQHTAQDDLGQLSQSARIALNRLSVVAGRFSPYKEDLKIPHAYYDSKDLHSAALQAGKFIDQYHEDSLDVLKKVLSSYLAGDVSDADFVDTYTVIYSQMSERNLESLLEEERAALNRLNNATKKFHVNEYSKSSPCATHVPCEL